MSESTLIVKNIADMFVVDVPDSKLWFVLSRGGMTIASDHAVRDDLPWAQAVELAHLILNGEKAWGGESDASDGAAKT